MNTARDQEPSIAVFCDFENVAIGVRDAHYDDFSVELAIERLLDKGKVVVKKAYADWERYKSARRSLHEAAFELIEIPHVSYSGKNSADIRLVVDALDLCYTKSHVDVFAIVSGDSDFSPLVSKLRENNKRVIGLGVKNSSSDLLVENCDEFIYYDDLVRARQKSSKRRQPGRSNAKDSQKEGGTQKEAPKEAAPREAPAPREPSAPKEESGRRSGARPQLKAADDDPEIEKRRLESMEYLLDTVDSLFRDRDDNLWGSMVKQTLKRKRPGFSETFHGYRGFTELLEDAQKRGLLELQKDERSGGYLIVAFGPNA